MSNDKDTFNVADLTSALNEENRADLINALKINLQSLAGQHSNVLESLSPNVRKRVEVLREIQDISLENKTLVRADLLACGASVHTDFF